MFIMIVKRVARKPGKVKVSTSVLKRNGRKEKFKSGKIRKSIENAWKGSDVTKAKAKTIAFRIARRLEMRLRKSENVKSSDIRSMILAELDKEDKKLAESFRAYSKH